VGVIVKTSENKAEIVIISLFFTILSGSLVFKVTCGDTISTEPVE